MKNILVITLCFVVSVTFAQEDGIRFYQGTWKETLAKAKAENKLIFIDVYTSWCGPCKIMSRDVFPLKTVGDKFNAGFVNYKIDAEKGEGIEIAQKYKVNAYPTYLFVNGDGVLYYTSLGMIPEAEFLKEANNALTEFKDPKPLAIWDAEYESRKGDTAFLLGYLEKRSKLRLKADFVADQYVSVASPASLMSAGRLSSLLRQESASIDGAFFKFLYENRRKIEEVLGRPAGSLNSIIGHYAASDFSRAVKNADVALLERIISYRIAAPSQYPSAWEADNLRMNYYLQTGDEGGLIKVLDRYSKNVLAYDKQQLKEANDSQLKRFEQALSSGQMGSLTEEQIAQSRKFYSSIEYVNYAYRVRSIAEAAFKGVENKRVLNEALSWLKVAEEYSDNFTILEATAGILHKLGRQQEAVAYQEKALDAFSMLKLEGDVIPNRLKGNLSKIKEGKPTWTSAPTDATVVTKQ